MSKYKKPELLAPAGDLQKLKYAIAYGADAVYLGLPAFSLRARTDFDLPAIKAGIAYAHKQNKKVYVAINIFAHNRHIKLLPEYLKKLRTCKPDAVIVSDPGVLLLVKKYLPQTAVHLSTQMNTLNFAAVRFWQQQGVKRIILGREASLQDIREIHRVVPKMELEVFVHGAMCLSYSGRCYLSSWLNQRSANLGLCAQPCRFEYKVFLEEKLRPGEKIPIETDGENTHIMNSKDLCLIDYLGDLEKAGVASFKIEGRTKSVYYVAVVTRAYRQAIDLISPPAQGGVAQSAEGVGENIKAQKQELNKIDNRGYTTGFLVGDEKNSREEFQTSKADCDWEFVGEIIDKKNSPLPEGGQRGVGVKNQSTKQIIYIKPHNVLLAGDIVEIVTPDKIYKTKFKAFFNDRGEKLKEIHGGTKNIYRVELPAGYDIVEMSVVRKRKNQNKLP